MTRERWHLLAGEWVAILGITERPRLVIVPASEIPGCDAVVEYFRAIEDGWTIKLRRGKHADAELTMVHELLHVKTGLTDQCHEPWIRDVAAALVALKRRAL